MTNCKALIATAIRVEREAVCSHLKRVEGATYKGAQYWKGFFITEDISWEVLVVETGVGNSNSSQETEHAINYFDPKVALFCGIAGGIKDVQIGDVVAGRNVYTYEYQKITESHGRTKIETRPCGYPSDYRLIELAKSESSKNDWAKRLNNIALEFKPKIKYDTIVSGEKLLGATKTELYEYLRDNYNQGIAVEMEGFGFLQAAHKNQKPAMVIRGISDLLDGKSKSDALGSQELASSTASAFAFEILAKLGCKSKSKNKQKEVSLGPAGDIINVPELPLNYLPRTRDLEAIKEALLHHDQEGFENTGSSTKLVLLGMSGIGKSVMAAAVARDKDIRSKFQDGVYWLQLGFDPKITRRQSDLAEFLGDGPRTFEDSQQGSYRLKKLLAKKACLIILDNVWHANDIKAFADVGPRCMMLITTQDASIISAAIASEYKLEILQDDEAKDLMAQWSGLSTNELPFEAIQIARKCGNQPLALALCGAKIKNGLTWKVLLEALSNADLRFLDDDHHGSVMMSMKVSLDLLSAHEVKRYKELVVFPPDEAVPECTILTLWAPSYEKEVWRANQLILEFEHRALLKREKKNGIVYISLHNLQHNYLKASQREDLKDDHEFDRYMQGLHMRLLEAYRQDTARYGTFGPNDGYFFQHLAYHLIAAKRKEELRELLLNIKWLQAKLDTTSINDLISDYDFLLEEEDLRLVQGAIRLSAHILSRDKTLLPEQLYGRLMGLKSNRLQAMVNQIGNDISKPWLRPIIPSLSMPGGPLIRILEGHDQSVTAVAIANDGITIVSASRDKKLRVWNIKTGEMLRTLEGHSGSVNAVAIANDGITAVSASGDKTLIVWNIKTGAMQRMLVGHSGSVNAVAIDPNGRIAISASGDKTLRVWDIKTGEELRTLDGHFGSVNAVAIGANGRIAISASKDKTLRVWDIVTWETLWTLEGHSGSVNAAAIAPNERIVISASDDKTLRVWDIETGEILKTLKGFKARIRAVAIAPDGRTAILASYDMKLIVLDLDDENKRQMLEGHTHWVSAVAIAPNEKIAVSASDDRTLRVWNIETMENFRNLEGNTQWVRPFYIAPDGRTKVSASDDKTLRVSDIETGKNVATILLDGPVNLCAISLEGINIIAGEPTGRVHFLRLENYRKADQIHKKTL